MKACVVGGSDIYLVCWSIWDSLEYLVPGVLEFVVVGKRGKRISAASFVRICTSTLYY